MAQQLEQERWRQTLQASESADQGKVVDAEGVNRWLNSWGSDHELDEPKSVIATIHNVLNWPPF